MFILHSYSYWKCGINNCENKSLEFLEFVYILSIWHVWLYNNTIILMSNVIAVKWGLHFKELAPELSIVIYYITEKHGFCVCWISISYWEIKWNQINMQCLKDTFAAGIQNFLPYSKFVFFQVLWQNQVFGYFLRQTDSYNILKLNVYHLQNS